METARNKAIEIIRKRGGIIRTREALGEGIHRRTLYGLRAEGTLIPTARGLHQLAEMESFPAEIDLVNMAKLVPHGVICLISALSFHELTTEIPHEIWLAVERKARKPKVAYPPVRAIFYPDTCFREGIETHLIMEQEVRIYSAPKTVIDCFRWRNTVGMDVVLEAARTYLKRRGASPSHSWTTQSSAKWKSSSAPTWRRWSRDLGISRRLNDYGRKVDDWFTNTVQTPAGVRCSRPPPEIGRLNCFVGRLSVDSSSVGFLATSVSYRSISLELGAHN